MIHYESYIKSSAKIISLFNNDEPFANYLKKYFAANKKFGSKDRKYITQLCYNYFRLGMALLEVLIEEKIFLATYFIGGYEKEFLLLLREDWMKYASKSSAEKLDALGLPFDEIFPYTDELSRGIDVSKLGRSYFFQPKLFLRFREQTLRYKLVEKLTASKLTYKWESQTCLSLENGINIEDVLKVGEDVIVQDYSSQQSLDFIKNNLLKFKYPNTDVWDCCAASGGKSILYYDIIGRNDTKITVSDIRLSIIQNLHQRFRKANIKHYNYFVCDIAKEANPFAENIYSNIICDVPCTGSGTWGRTPEQLCFFKKEKIKEYTALQQKIVTNAAKQLKKDGHLFYITCSIFKQENEEQVNFIKEKLGLTLLESKVIVGYENFADTMFAAVFTKK